MERVPASRGRMRASAFIAIGIILAALAYSQGRPSKVTIANLANTYDI